jgi:hypothetical protein
LGRQIGRYREVGFVCAAALLLASALTPRVLMAQNGATAGGTTCERGVISAIDLDRRSVFDPESTSFGPLAWAYRALNLLHVRTAPSFIRRELLVAEGDCFDPFLVSESERLLDQYGFLSQARITHEDDGSGGRRLLVSTRDEWSTKVDVGVTYDAGPNLEKLQVTEENFLGQGVFAEFTHRERRETKTQAFGLATPRLFGRTDASIAWGQARPGHFFHQYLRYPFIGETGDYSVRQGFDRGTTFFSYSTDGAEAYSQVLVPVHRELVELSAARRFGGPGRSVIAGLTITRDVWRFDGTPEVVLADDFDDLQPFPGPLPTLLADHLRPSASTRVALQLGTRRYTYREFEGLDAVRDRMLVSVGVFAGLTVGRGLGIFAPEGVRAVDDVFGRGHVSFGAPVGSSLFHGGLTIESRRDAGQWRDVLADTDLVAYLRSEAFASHTIFARASFAGGWNTELPFQLSLGGREGVRSLVEDRFPGGRMARFVLEDRVVLPWPPPGVGDLGLTAFADLGRIWRGNVPYGVDSGWEAALGLGVRIGLPANTRNAWRADVAFPVGPGGGDPIFRVTFELNRLRTGFFTPDVFRSRRFNLGPDHF